MIITILSLALTISLLLNVCFGTIIKAKVIESKGLRKFTQSQYAQLLEKTQALGIDIDTDFNETENVNTKTYGHPFPPVGIIRAAMPPLSDNFLWESWIETDSGQPVFTVQLVETTTQSADVVISQRRIDLSREGITMYGTWAEFYSRKKASQLTVKDIEDLKKLVTGETIDWMVAEAFKSRKDRQGYEVRR